MAGVLLASCCGAARRFLRVLLIYILLQVVVEVVLETRSYSVSCFLFATARSPAVVRSVRRIPGYPDAFTYVFRVRSYVFRTVRGSAPRTGMQVFRTAWYH